VHYLVGERVGPVTPELFRYFVPELTRRDVYLCGSPRLAAGVRLALARAGLPEAQRHEERFEF
jgi:ferredoxin-NADP reductase